MLLSEGGAGGHFRKPIIAFACFDFVLQVCPLGDDSGEKVKCRNVNVLFLIIWIEKLLHTLRKQETATQISMELYKKNIKKSIKKEYQFSNVGIS